MMRIARLLVVVTVPLLLVVLLSSLLTYPAQATPSSVCEPDGLLPSGAYYRICMPSGEWNGNLAIYAHGYVAFNKPITIPEDQLQLPGGSSLPELINSLGFAFATTSYRMNGLAIKTGVDDLVDVVNVFSATHSVPTYTLVTGVSEGGLITALAIEQRPDVFDGGLATCGPIGDFSQQINYFGDFRVLFDYFFPGVIPGSPVSIPLSLINDWPHYYTATIQPLIFAPTNAVTLAQLLNVSHAPYVSGLITTVDTSVYDALSYNVMATNDAVEKLGGQPFENRKRVYAGSANDMQLNQLVQRFGADAVALDNIDLYYQTTGMLTVPLVTLHTTLDQQVPYWHAQLYRGKVIRNDSLAFHQARVGENLYGHCNFSSNDALSAFGKLVTMVYSPTARFPSPRQYLPQILNKP
jgi:pimeloyl-ACP methyl ester carboxylesterase